MMKKILSLLLLLLVVGTVFAAPPPPYVEEMPHPAERWSGVWMTEQTFRDVIRQMRLVEEYRRFSEELQDIAINERNERITADLNLMEAEDTIASQRQSLWTWRAATAAGVASAVLIGVLK